MRPAAQNQKISFVKKNYNMPSFIGCQPIPITDYRLKVRSYLIKGRASTFMIKRKVNHLQNS